MSHGSKKIKANLASDEHCNVGKTLRKARQKSGLNLSDIARDLKLPESALQAIENNQFNALHGEFFARSYIRAYASKLDICDTPLLASYAEQTGNKTEELASVSMLALENSRFQHKHFRTYIGLAAIACLVLLGFLGNFFTADESNESDVGAVELNAELKGLETTLDSSSIDNLNLLLADSSAEPEPAPVTAVESIEVVNTNRVTQQETVLIQSTLNFRFTADCWVEIVNGDNERVHASLKKSDEFFELSGKPPFRITLGYAPGVSLSYNGEPVAINVNSTGNKLTKLVLGNS